MNRWLVVFKKEVRDMFRDRRVRSGAFIMPVFMIILFVQLFAMIEDTVKKPKKQAVAVVGIQLDQASEKLIEQVAGTVTHVTNRAEGVKELQKGKVKLVVDFGHGLEAGLNGHKAVVQATYDPSEPLSQIALGTLRETVSALNKTALDAQLKAVGATQVDPDPIKFESKEAERAKGLGGSTLVGLLPYLIVIWAFYGGFSIVADLVAGEKERGTMETLLVSPLTRREAALGKYLSLCLVCLLSSLMSLVAILVLGALHLGNTAVLFPTGFSLSGPALAAMALALIPLVLMFAGILLTVSAASKNMREAQTYLTLVSFVVIMPAIFSQFLGFTGMANAVWVKWTPVLGSAVCLREALLGKTDWAGLGSTVLSCLLISVVFLVAAFKLFERESILARS